MKTFPLFIILLTLVKTMGSGSYKPPSVKWFKSRGLDPVIVKEGKALFAGNSGTFKGQSCNACHGKPGDNKFKRSKIKKLKLTLGKQIEECMNDENRAGLQDAGKEHVHMLGSYIISRYKMKKAFMVELKKFTGQ